MRSDAEINEKRLFFFEMLTCFQIIVWHLFLAWIMFPMICPRLFFDLWQQQVTSIFTHCSDTLQIQNARASETSKQNEDPKIICPKERSCHDGSCYAAVLSRDHSASIIERRFYPLYSTNARISIKITPLFIREFQTPRAVRTHILL